MAIRTFCDSVLRGKLAAVRIGVASFAILCGSLELNFVRARKRLVALATHHYSMSTGQRKFCFRMVKSTDVDPGPGAVARFTT